MIVVFKFFMLGILLPILAIFGLVGNCLSTVVLRSNGLDMKASFCELLIMLSLFDSFFLIFVTISFTLPSLSQTWSLDIHPIIFPWIFPFLQIALNGSVWSTVAVAVERFSSVVFPTQCSRYSAYSRYYYILPVFLLTSMWNIPRFLELKTCYKLNNSEVSFCERRNSTDIDCKLTFCATELRRNLSYCRDFILIGNFLIMVFLPLFLLIVLNGHIYRVLVKSSRRKRKQSIIKKRTNSKRDRRITTILMMIVIVFGCCNVPRVFINTFEVVHLAVEGTIEIVPWPLWCEVVSIISTILLVFNSSINILIYCWKDETFMKVLFSKLGMSDRLINHENKVNLRHKEGSKCFARLRKGEIVRPGVSVSCIETYECETRMSVVGEGMDDGDDGQEEDGETVEHMRMVEIDRT